MKVARYYNNNDVRLDEIPKPTIGPGELLVKVKKSGICGSDVLEYYRLAKMKKLGVDNLILGHEIAGDIVEVGDGIKGYKIGDRGSINLSNCPCGRGFIRLNNVYGRIIDIFMNSKGELVYGDYFTHLFYFRENVKQFQVVQEKLDKIIIKIVTNDNKPLESSIIKDIEDKIKIVMGENCRVIFEYVDYINPSRSGKYIYTISNVYKSSNF